MPPPTYLADKHPHERDTHISFEEGPHIYTIDGDSDYTSVTTWNHSHFPHFNPDAVIKNMMNGRNWTSSKYFGMEPEQIKQQWKENGREASSAGTKLHYDIECFYNDMTINNKSTEYGYFLRFHKAIGSSLKPYRTEWMIYHKELRLAGSIDMTFELPDGSLAIYDWKRCREIKKTNPWESGTTSCVSHIPNSNFWLYSLQLNVYKAILESKYNKKISGMYLICLHPFNKNKSFLRIEVPHLKQEIADLFAHRRQEIEPPTGE